MEAMIEECDSIHMDGWKCDGHHKTYELHSFSEAVGPSGIKHYHLWLDHESKQAREARVAEWEEVLYYADNLTNRGLASHLRKYAKILEGKIDARA